MNLGAVLMSLALIVTNVTGCSASNFAVVTAAEPVLSPSRVAIPTPQTSAKVICGKTQYDLLQVESVERQASDVKLVRDDSTVVKVIQMPNQSEYQGFAIDWVKPSKNGFQISIEWGTRIFHHIDFDFDCKKTGFYLSTITHETFDKHYPENEKLYKTRIKKIIPLLPIEKFAVRNFMID